MDSGPPKRIIHPWSVAMALLRYRDVKGALINDGEPPPIDADDRGAILVLLLHAYAGGEITLDRLAAMACSVASGYGPATARNHVGWVMIEASKHDPPKRGRGNKGMYPYWVRRLSCWIVDIVSRDEGVPISRESRTPSGTAYDRAAAYLRGFGLRVTARQLEEWRQAMT